MALPAMVAPALIMGGATIGSSLLGNKKKTSQVPMEPPEVTAARRALYNYSQTGKFGDYTAGEEVPLGYGDYNATDIEQSGQSSLRNLLASGIPEQFKMGDDALRGILDGSQANIDAMFDPYKTQVERQIRDSETALKRSAGFAGNLYSTNTIRELGDIQARGNETLASQLANLNNEALNRRLQAVPLAYESGTAQEGINLNRIGASQQYGGLTRQLNDASIKARDAEALRRRSELQGPISAAQSVIGSAPTYGVPSVTTPSPFQNVLDMVANIGGQYVGNQMFLNQYKNAFPTGATPQSTTGYPYSFGNRLSLG